MFTGEIKKNLFKVKKVKINGEEIQGVVAPLFNSYRCEFKCNEFKFITGNRCYELHSSYYPIKTTKVGNEKLKKIYEDIIVEEKKGYKLYLDIIKLEEQKKKISDKVHKSYSKTQLLMNKVVKVQGFITKDEFFTQFKDIINKTYKGYTLEFDIKSNKLVDIKLSKEVELGRWIKEHEYDFLFEEYDSTLHVNHDYLRKSESMKAIIKEHFRTIADKKIDKYNISQYYDAGIGDKRTLYVEHNVNIAIKKPIELKKSNMKEIKDIVREFIKVL